MKVLYSLLIFALIVIVTSIELCGTIQGSSYDECKSYELPPGKQHCCYLYYSAEKQEKNEENKYCYPASEEEYKDTKKFEENFIRQMESKGYKVNEIKLDCGQQTPSTSNGQYIQFPFAFLLLFLN